MLDADIDASVFVGYPAARDLPRLRRASLDPLHPGPYQPGERRARLLAAQTDPEDPTRVSVSLPSAALVAQAEAKSAFNGLFLGLGAVALLVGAIGVANIMVISVLERRSEIGLRRALGATKGHIRAQFLAEAVLLAAGGGVIGVAAGGAGHRGLRHGQGLGGGHPAARVGRGVRRGAAHRRRGRAAARTSRRADVADQGAVERMSGRPGRNPGLPVMSHQLEYQPSFQLSQPPPPQLSQPPPSSQPQSSSQQL